MSSALEISPNEPDAVPDYVDGGASAPPRRRPAAPAGRGGAGHREGECVPNVPDAAPAFIAADEERALLEAASAPLPAPEIEASAPAASPWWKWHLTATILLAGIFGVLVFGQAVSVASFAATLPAWAQYALLVPFGLCCLAVLWACAGLFRSWLRLRAVRQIDLAALEELRLRAETRRDGVEHYQAARTRAEGYLAAYPLAAGDRPRLIGAGLSPERIDALAAGRDFLAGRAQESRAWLAEFRDQYQGILDDAAAARVSSWSLKAAGCVIASPLPLLDAALVLGIAFKLIRDLSVIYNVRAGRAGTLLILNRAITAAFIAGVAEDAAEAAGGMASEQLAGLVGDSIGIKLAGAVTPKLGEGAINALFIRRLGKAAVRLLQPTTPRARKGKQ